MDDRIVRRVIVDRTRTPQQMLDATKYRQYIDRRLVETMPRGNDIEVDVIFFKGRRFLSDIDLEEEFALQLLVPADPYLLAAVNEADPAFADDHPNATHWRNERGHWCSMTFRCWGPERRVDLFCDGDGWRGLWWFAGRCPLQST